MSNETIDEAQTEAILSGGQVAVNRYMVAALQQLIAKVEAMPTFTEQKIADHKVDCRGQSRRSFYGFLVAVGTCVGLATPYVLRLLG